MVSELHQFQLTSRPDDLLNITDHVRDQVQKCSIKDGIVTIYVPGSTAGISFVEYEPGLIQTDIPHLLQSLMPKGPDYAHHQTWHDHNGHSHLRSFMIPPSLTVPVTKGQLLLGTWQQIVLCEFDEKSRNRTVYCQFVG